MLLSILIPFKKMISIKETRTNRTATRDCTEALIIKPERAVLTGNKQIYKINSRELYLKPDLSANTFPRQVRHSGYSPVAAILLIYPECTYLLPSRKIHNRQDNTRLISNADGYGCQRNTISSDTCRPDTGL